MSDEILSEILVLPAANMNHASGFTSANATTVGASSLKMPAAADHFGPRKTRTISSAKSRQLQAIGRIKH